MTPRGASRKGRCRSFHGRPGNRHELVADFGLSQGFSGLGVASRQQHRHEILRDVAAAMRRDDFVHQPVQRRAVALDAAVVGNRQPRRQQLGHRAAEDHRGQGEADRRRELVEILLEIEIEHHAAEDVQTEVHHLGDHVEGSPAGLCRSQRSSIAVVRAVIVPTILSTLLRLKSGCAIRR